MEEDKKQPTNGGSVKINFGLTGIEGKDLKFPPETAATKKGLGKDEPAISIRLEENTREINPDAMEHAVENDRENA